MAGVVAALIAHHDIEPLGEDVDNFAFAFVPPLRTQDNDVPHATKPPYCNVLYRLVTFPAVSVALKKA